jgi:hypothetical protein
MRPAWLRETPVKRAVRLKTVWVRNFMMSWEFRLRGKLGHGLGGG